jgi:Fe-S-cluster containining protein
MPGANGVRRHPALPVWYGSGLRFECRPDCGQCCTSHGEHAYVYLERGEARRIARHLELSERQFRARYTARDEGQLVLRMDEPDCPFLDGKRCGIYPVRPLQCRTFPFWSENLATRASWRRTARFCPGIDRGPLHPLACIERARTSRKP